MAQIKETVDLLTKILRSNGFSKVRAETFRLAKFNKDDATESMWRLLFEVIYYLKHNEIDDVTIEAYAELTKEELTVYVKTELKQLGFVSRMFHELSPEMASGSRELLLAFGWFLCRCNLIGRFMEQRCSALTSTIEVTNCGTRQDSLPGCSSNDPANKVQYLMWLNGRLRMSLRNLHTLQQHRDRLTAAVQEATRGVSTNPTQRGSLTVLEVMMLRNPELLKKNLALLEEDNSRLQALLSWKDHEHIFWKWMESVLDAKLSENGLIDEVSDKVTPRTQSVKGKVDGKLHISDAVKKYELIVQQLQRDLVSKKGRSVKVEDIDTILAGITAEISLHMSNLKLASPAQSGGIKSSVINAPIARVKPTPREGSVAGSVCSVSAAEEELNKMEYELNQLQDLVERLQQDIEYKQHKYREEISSMSESCETLTSGPALFLSYT